MAADLVHTALINRQLLEARPGRHAYCDRVPIHKRLFRRQRNDVPSSLCLLIAVLKLVAELDGLLLNEVQFRDDPVHPARCSGHEVSDRDKRLAVVESLARGYELHLIGLPRRALCRRIETANRLDHVANKLHAHGFDSSRWKHVDDSASNGEGSVLIDGVFAGETSIDQQVGEFQRLDLRANSKLDRGLQHALG